MRHIFALRVELEAIAIEWAKEHATRSGPRSLRLEIRRRWKLQRRISIYRHDSTKATYRFTEKFGVSRVNPYLVDVLERLVVPLCLLSS